MSEIRNSFQRQMEQYQKEKAERNKAMTERMNTEAPKIRLELLAMGAKSLEVTYDGSGDDGCIEALVLHDAKGNIMGFHSGNHVNPKQFAEAVAQIFYDLIETRGADFNNDGCYGEITWDLEADTLKHSHHDRITTTEDTEYEGW